MKKFRFLAALLLIVSIVVLPSCGVLDYAIADNTQKQENDYMTKEEVQALLDSVQKDITLYGGDNFDISINSQSDGNLLAASKGLLSAVSIVSTFKVTKYYYGGFMSGTQTVVEEEKSAGAGVIYSIDKSCGDAYIITNYHVVYNKNSNTENNISNDIKLYLYGQEYERYAVRAEYIGGSSNYDIAVLKVSGSPIIMESIAELADFADSKSVAVLDTAIAIGNPTGGGISATVGAVNVDSEEITITNVQETGVITLRVMRIDAAVNGGNSGGALFNSKGEVIGIVNAKMSSSSVDNIGYAIPSNVAKNVAENIIYYDSIDPTCDSVMRTIIGIEPGIDRAYSVYDSETGKVHKMERVKVANVTSGSAASGKIFANDILNSITIDGEKIEITRKYDIFDAMLKVKNSDSFKSTIVINVTRGETTLDVQINVADATRQAW